MYLGNQPALSYTSFTKQDFTVTATTSYTLDHSVSNENEIALFINFVRQEPTTAYTASGTSLTLTEATSVGDDMYCVFIGKATQTVNPADNTITNDMLSETITVANGGTGLTSGFKNGITMSDSWRLSSDQNSGTNGTISAGWEQVDESRSDEIGTALTESSGIFSFSSTGIYLLIFTGCFYVEDGDSSVEMDLLFTNNNSSYNVVTKIHSGNRGSNVKIESNTGMFMFNITDTSLQKFKFRTTGFNTGTVMKGDTAQNETHFALVRLGDT